MTDTFQGGKGLSGKIERLIWKRADTEKRSKKEHFYFQSWLHQREGSTMIRPVSNCWKKVDKKQSLCDKWKTRVRPVLNKRKSWNKSWLTGLTTAVVGWLGKKHIWTRGKTRVRPVPSKRKSWKKSWLRVVGWLKEAYLATDWPWIDVPPQKCSQTRVDWQAWQQWLVDWKKAWVHFYCQPSLAAASPYIRHSQLQNNQELPAKSDWYHLMHQKWNVDNSIKGIKFKFKIPHNYLIKIAHTSQNFAILQFCHLLQISSQA